MVLLDVLRNKKEGLYRELQELSSIQDQVEDVLQEYADKVEAEMKNAVQSADDDITDIIMGTAIYDWDEYEELDLHSEIDYNIKERVNF